MNLKTRRMNHIFKEDGKALIVAMDHGTFNGAAPGLEHPGETLQQIAEGGADAVLCNFGVARKFAKELAPLGYIARLDLPPTYMGQGHDSRLVFDAEYALRMGADAVMVNVGQGVDVEEPTYPHLAETIAYCDSVGLPVCSEPVPGGFDAGPEFKTLDNIARGARIACEIGCDFMKVGYAPGFERIVDETFVPLVVLGGAKTDNEKEFLASIKNAMDAGASGVAIGRNVWGGGNTVNMTRALAAIIHKDASVDEAYAILKGRNNMKAAIMPEAGKIELVDVVLPEMQDDEVLVDVKAVGICTFEQKFYYGKSNGFPFAGGHEICGVVNKVGSKVAQDLKTGDKVVVLSLTRCGECYYCRHGYDNQCENAKDVQKVPGVDGPGGFAEQFIAKGYEVYKIDEDVPFERGTLAEPLSCVTHSMNMSGIQTGDYALISGAGAMGIIHVLLAKLRGAKVIVSEPTKERRDRALEFGADYVVDPIQEDLEARVREITNGRGVERAFFTAGGKVAIESSIQALAIRGTLVIYGGTGPNDQFMVDPKWFHYNEITITGVTKHTKETIRVATELLSMKNLPLDKLITSEFPFEKIEDALIEARNISSYRPVVLIGEK